MTNEYINRQLLLLKDFISDYENERISLNRFVMRIEAILVLDDMEDAYKTLSGNLSVLEDINAAAFEGVAIDDNDKETIKKIVFEMSEYIDSRILED